MNNDPGREKLTLRGELASNQDQLERLFSAICEIDKILFTLEPEKQESSVESPTRIEEFVAMNRRFIDRSVSLVDSIINRLT